MPPLRPRLRSIASGLAATAVAVSGLVALAPPASALAAPGGLKSDVANSSTVILSWSRIAKATTYEVQVDSTDSFSSPDYTQNLPNTKAVPTKALVPGKNFWRVRAVGNGKQSSWVVDSSTSRP